MTAAEAKGKWCPMFQVAITPDAWIQDNRGKRDSGQPNCLAEGCACWVTFKGYLNHEEPQGRCGLVR